MYSEGFASKLKASRLKWGFTQKDVQRETGISQSAITKYENARLEPSLETLGILAEFYQVSTDWLLGINSSQHVEPIIRKKTPPKEEHPMRIYVNTSKEAGGNKEMYIDLTPEQIERIRSLDV